MARRLTVGMAVIVLTIVALVSGGALLLRTAPGRDYVRRLLVARLTDQVNGQVAIGRLGGGLPNEVVLRDVALTDSAGSLVFTAARIAARVNITQLFSKRIDIAR